VLVIFDCDGVLVDSEPHSNAAMAAVLTAHGLPMTAEQSTAEFLGRSWASCEVRIAELLGRPAPAGLQAAYEAARDAAFRDGLAAVPGVHAAIDAVEAEGALTCVASSGDHAKMAFTLGLTGLHERFAGRIFSVLDVEHGKPAPDLFLHAAASMGVAPSDCTVVEDSPVGVRAARAAGMTVLGFAGRTDPAALAGADAVFGAMAELPGLVTPPGYGPRRSAGLRA
jgi:HAD superfamily hydrolase (TIGR01509 family)